MATMTIKTTYSLDLGTVRALEDLARRWSVSKSEALRRAIRSELERQPSRRDTRMRALRELQASVARRGVDLAAWEREAREMRRASFPRLPGDPE
ncbi:MAG: ribbon-helix-helix protein, CopG family [Acidobacteria bacterium]|nr:ribbon-helix-helix protein, CopG family [Acidobacteriota bacterium]MXX86595.1 ribbon-helix-helix protein, CopG family [Acidobacteriota bacterium]MYE43544.1 ribbon-helix-helix protein, CopG family [Acidobacteriota bacterium]MYG75631.1 ribbon-helix-helix protein, CopG family [Acidobacteriota bacterium]